MHFWEDLGGGIFLLENWPLNEYINGFFSIRYFSYLKGRSFSDYLIIINLILSIILNSKKIKKIHYFNFTLYKFINLYKLALFE